MEFADRPQVETDRVSSFLLALAVGLMVLGVLFGALDESGLLTRPAATVVQDPAVLGHEG
jgi:hypothetical protein